MRNILPKLVILAAISQPIAAHADPIDDFILTYGFGDTITFSLPASPPVFGPSNPLLFETFPVLLSFDPAFFGNKNLDGQLVFYSESLGGGLKFIISHPGGGPTELTDHGDLLYSGTTAEPTFLTGTFNVGDILTITPQTGPAPEPSPLVLLGTGTLGILCLRGALRQRGRHTSPAG